MTVLAGTQFEVNGNAGEFANVVNLTSTTAICFYSLTGGPTVEAKHLTLTGITLTAGAALTIDAAVTGTLYIRSARLTDTSVMVVYSYGTTHRAQVITVSGTTLSAGAITNLTDNTNINFTGIDTVSATACIYVYSDSVSDDGKARILSVSGTTITENAAFTYDANCFNSDVAVLSATKAVVAFGDASNSNQLTAEVLDIAGTTITGNADQVLSTSADVDVNIPHRLSIVALDSSHITVSWFKLVVSTFNFNVTASEAGGVLTPGTTTTMGSGAGPQVASVALSSSRMVSVDNAPALGQRISAGEFSVSGVTMTLVGLPLGISTGAGSSNCWITALDRLSMILVWETNASIEAIPVFISPALTIASMTKPASIDASGEFVYVALLGDTFPILSKISTDLNADGVTVFDPGSGSDIGVECGRFDNTVVWIAGTFDGTNRVEKSEDSGDTFVVKDDASFGGVTTFVVGPDSDDRVLIVDTGIDIQETIDSGEIWTERLSGSGIPAVSSVARLDTNVQEMAVGTEGDSPNNINYTVNSGTDLEDYEDGTLSGENIHSLIVNG